MKTRTVYFIKSLWDEGVKRELLLPLIRSVIEKEYRLRFSALKKGNFLFVSDRAKELENAVSKLEKRVYSIKNPDELIWIAEEMDRISGEMYALQIITSQELNRKGVVELSNIHIVFDLLSENTLKIIKQEIAFRLFRLLVLNEKDYENGTLNVPQIDDLISWIQFEQISLSCLINAMGTEKTDSRWAYELQEINLTNGIIFNQFLCMEVLPEEINIPPGMVKVQIGEKNRIRISGRGRISNINPYKWNMDLNYAKQLPLNLDYSSFGKEDDPKSVLDDIFDKTDYMIKPKDYFELVNKKIIVEEFDRRIAKKLCLFCGREAGNGRCCKYRRE